MASLDWDLHTHVYEHPAKDWLRLQFFVMSLRFSLEGLFAQTVGVATRREAAELVRKLEPHLRLGIPTQYQRLLRRLEQLPPQARQLPTVQTLASLYATAPAEPVQWQHNDGPLHQLLHNSMGALEAHVGDHRRSDARDGNAGQAVAVDSALAGLWRTTIHTRAVCQHFAAAQDLADGVSAVPAFPVERFSLTALV